MKVYNKEKWGSLTDLKNAIEKKNIEQVEYFNGIELVTNLYNYKLAFGEVCRTKRKAT